MVNQNKNIGNLPGYTELVHDWQNLQKKMTDGFTSREDWYDWMIQLHAVSLNKVPENINRLFMSYEFFETMFNQLTGKDEKNRIARELLLGSLIKRSVPEAFGMYATRAQEINVAEKGDNFLRGEEP